MDGWMMNGGCVCAECCHPACPPVKLEPPYDEVSHEIADSRISIKLGKNVSRARAESLNEKDLDIDTNCVDFEGKKCREGCAKVNVIPNQEPPMKKPEQEMFLLRTTKQITHGDDLKNGLEIEFKAARNYVPLPDLGPPPPIIVPRVPVKKGKSKRGKSGKSKRKKKS